MSADDPTDPTEGNDTDDIEPSDVRAELDRQRTRARGGTEEGGDGLVELLSRAFDTDTRLRIYVHLRRHPHSTPGEVAEGTGIYPAAVRRVLSELRDEDAVESRERRTGSNDAPEYTAVPPNELVDVVVGQIRDELGSGRRRDAGTDRRGRSEPVTIPVEPESDEDADEK